MPRVPTAEGFGVLPGIRSGGARPVLSVEQAAQPGRQMQARGEQMVQIGGLVGDYAQQQQERVNRARVQDATMQAERLALEYRQQMEQLKGAQAAEGINGMPLGVFYSKELERGTAEIEQGLGSPAAREAFRVQALALQSRFGERAMLYEAEQAEIFIGQTQDTLITHNLNFLAGSAGGPEEGMYRDRLSEAYAEKFRQSGFTGESLKQKVQEEMAKSHAIIIEQYLNDDQYTAAKEYFERYKETDFSTIDAKKIEDGMAEQGRELEAVGKADKIWNDSKFQYGEALIAARRITDPQERKAVEAQLAVLHTQDRAAKDAKDNSDYETGVGYVNAGRSIPGTLLAEASPLVVAKLQTMQEAKAERARAAAAMTAEEKAALREISTNNYNVLKLQAANPEYARLGLAGLLADPALQSRFDNMTSEDQDKLILDIDSARQGVPVDQVTKTTKAILATANAMLPPTLKQSQIGGLGRGEIGERYITSNLAKSDLALETEGTLFRLVQEELALTNGAPIDATRSEQLFGLALAEAGGLTSKGVPKYAPSRDVLVGDIVLQTERKVLDYRAKNPDIWKAATVVARNRDPNATSKDVLKIAIEMEVGLMAKTMTRVVTGQPSQENVEQE